MEVWGLDREDTWCMVSLLCILRIPGIALLDIWWMDHSASSIPVSLQLSDIADSGINLLILILALVLLLLPLIELVTVYAHILASAALGLSFLIATQFVEDERKVKLDMVEQVQEGLFRVWGADIARRHLCPLASYITLTHFISWCCNLTNPVFKKVGPSLYILPVLVNLLGFPLALVTWVTRVVSGYLVLSVILYSLSKIWSVICYMHETMLVYQIVKEELGPFNVLVLTIRRMLEPSVLGCYWITLFLAQLWSNSLELADKKYVIQDSDWIIQGVVAMAEICESPLLLISFCVVVMGLSCGALFLVKYLLSTCGAAAGGHNLLQSGVTEGVVAFVLGLQTGLTEMEMPGRVGALSIIIFVVVASLLQSCLEITHPILLSLPATNRKIIRHLLPVLLTILLFCLPILMVYALLTKISSDMWTLVIISTCLVTAVQAMGHLFTYSLFVWDSMLAVPSPNMDDYVYYIKATTRVVELLLALAVVSGGFYESVALDREWSLLNTMVLICHCYFNIYSRISQGWASYLARRETSARLNNLNTATKKQLEEHGDVCSICYQDMETPLAVVTQCSHYFHKNCLKRWLVVQDNCPLCTKAIVADDKGDNTELSNSQKPNETLGDERQDGVDIPDFACDADENDDVPENEFVDMNNDAVDTAFGDQDNFQPDLRQRHIGNLFDGD